MKKVFTAFLLLAGLAGSSHAFTATNYLQASSGTVMPGLLYLSSGTFSTQLNVPNATAANNAVAFGQLPVTTLFQTVFSSTTLSATTTSASYVSTSSTATIIPTSVSNRVSINVNCNIQIAAGQVMNATIYSGVGNLGPAAGMWAGLSQSGGNTIQTCNMNWIDSPATTSPVTYTVYMKVAGAAPLTWNSLSTACTMELQEIK